MTALKGKGAYLYVVSYVAGANPNTVWAADAPERIAHAERLAEMAQAAGLTHVLIKVADGVLPYNQRRKLPDGRVIFNSTLPDAVDDCPLVVKALQARGIQVLGWQFVYGQSPEKEAAMAIQRINELGLDGWVVNAEYAHKSYWQNGKVVDGYRLDRSQPFQETMHPSADMVLRVGKYMAPVRAETLRRRSLLWLSSYKYPTVHPSFPFAAFLSYCDGNMPQVYPIGDLGVDAHSRQLARSLAEYRAISDVPIVPTGGAFSESYVPYGQSKPVSWVATPEQVTDFFQACEREGMPACNVWDWYSAADRFPELWAAVAAYVWPGSVETPPQGAGDPPPWRSSAWWRLIGRLKPRPI